MLGFHRSSPLASANHDAGTGAVYIGAHWSICRFIYAKQQEYQGIEVLD
jgi:hypothetical protein